jgi:hypothetical protein
LVVECSILVELVVHGGIAHFLVVHGGKGNYPFFFLWAKRKKKMKEILNLRCFGQSLWCYFFGAN